MKEYKLGDIVTFNYGKSLPKTQRVDGPIPVMSSAGITGWHNKSIIEGPGVIVGRKGSIGTVFYENRDFYPIDTCYFVTVNDSEILDLKFLYYLLLGSNLKELNSDAAVPGLNREIAYSQKFKIPSIEVQLEIVKLVDSYDNLIENNNRRIAILEDMAQSLYREWFVNFRYPGHADAVDKDGNQKLIDSPLGQIPEGWEVKPISASYKTSSGGTPSRSQSDYYGDDHWWVKTKELKDGFVVAVDERISDLGLKRSSAKLFPKHSVLLAMYGATIGRLGILSEEASSNQACCALLPLNDSMSNWFIYLLLLTDRKKLISLGQGAAQQNISQSVIQDFKILVPTDYLLNMFNIAVEPMFSSIENLSRRNMNLKKQRDMLLPKLISGQIELKD